LELKLLFFAELCALCGLAGVFYRKGRKGPKANCISTSVRVLGNSN
jgi:hypothetical protein